MRKLILIILFFISIDSFCQPNIYEQLTDSVDREWIKPNPKLLKTSPSFFNKENSKEYFVAPVRISGLSTPFSRDSDLSILKFLTSIDSDLEVLKGENADPIYKGIKLKWHNSQKVLIWINEQFYESKINNWHLIGESDCPGNIIFPIILFDKIFELPNARINNLKGLMIVPFNKEIKNISESETKLFTKEGLEMTGVGYDLDNDKINDIFIHSERIDELDMTHYIRMYINIEGQWVCNWIHLDEDCI